MKVVFGGAFDPPHNGHVALVRAAKEHLGVARLLVLVSADPGHKRVATPAAVRLELARAAFPDDDVELDAHPRTVDLLRAHAEWVDPVFVVGADEFAEFLSWKEPGEILRLARLAVAARPGYPRELLEDVLERLAAPERVHFFELAEPQASRVLRARPEPREMPPAVAAIVERDGLYGQSPGYTEDA
ncbi:MAG: adenylyltransferase/cytidyltransferase family protein [Actinobacteria bacterium]|nr:adenylyltransferase/cytidyltransferase family protein [Actinomycetota bacterium]MBV8599704.1 adenylyltransferase/cytidyltransferase family protein [Actinomycetota bacterium]